ncbi:MAG: diaminopimelate epimerase [Pseudomonadota bacterium]
MAQTLPFLKMHGLGNDFVVLDARATPVTLSPARVRALADRNRGVGFDQMAVITGDDAAHAAVSYWNTDGTLSNACGNATRCVARLVMEDTGTRSVTLRTGRGLLQCDAAGDGLIRVNMGPPERAWQDIPLAHEVPDLINLPLDGAPGAVGMGNPHCVHVVEDVGAIALAEIGPQVEHHPLFPQRTNVEFVQALSRSEARLRVWERGVGITLACGSGACATAVVAHLKGALERQVTLHMDGGPLALDWREDGVWMTGPTALTFEGTLSAEFLEAHP